MYLDIVLSVLFVTLFCILFFKTFELVFKVLLAGFVIAFATFIVILMVKSGVWHPLIRLFLVMEFFGIAS